MNALWLAVLVLGSPAASADDGASKSPEGLRRSVNRDLERVLSDKRKVDEWRQFSAQGGSGRDEKDSQKEVREAVRQLREDEKEYLKAEKAYFAETGSYVHPQLYDALTGEKKEASSLAPEQAAQPPPQPGMIPEPGPGRAVTQADSIQAGPLIEGPAASGAPQAPRPPRTPIEAPSIVADEDPGGGGPLGPPAAPSLPVHAPEAAPVAPSRAEASALPAPQPEAAALAPESGAQALRGKASPADARVYEAERALAGGRLDDALRVAQAAVAADGVSPDAHRVLSQVLARAGRWEEAEREAQEAVRLNDRDAASQRALAWAELHLGKYEEAAAAASRALALNPQDAQAYALRAFALEKLGRRVEMIDDLRRAAALDPERYKPLLERAQKGFGIFDPADKEGWRLLEGAPLAGRGGSAPGAGAAAVAVLVALGLLPVWRRLNVQAVETTAMGKASPIVRAAASDGVAEAEQARLLAGKYELRVLIGRGGMAQVWEGYDRSLRRPAAIKKVIIPEGPRAESRRQLALQEARTLATLRHPNIVDIFEVLELDAGLYLVFEFLKGKTLQQILAEHRRLPWPRVQVLLKPACAALEFAHGRGFVHRDFKPSNVMVLPDGRVKVMDFGIARSLSEGDSPVEAAIEASAAAPRPLVTARTSNLVGTPGYRPPEAEKGVVSVAFDVYSLGAVAFEAVVGELPPRPGPGSFERVWQRLQAAAPDLPSRAGKAIQAALHPDMRQRAQSVEYFRCQALEI